MDQEKIHTQKAAGWSGLVVTKDQREGRWEIIIMAFL